MATNNFLRIATPSDRTWMDSASKSYQDEQGAVSDEIINVSHRLEHLYDAIETGMIGLGDLAPRIQELRGRQEKLQARKVQIESLLSDRRVELASPQIVSRYVGDLRDLLANSSLTEKRAL
jgi:site-specific DNA recombinase